MDFSTGSQRGRLRKAPATSQQPKQNCSTTNSAAMELKLTTDLHMAQVRPGTKQ